MVREGILEVLVHQEELTGAHHRVPTIVFPLAWETQGEAKWVPA